MLGFSPNDLDVTAKLFIAALLGGLIGLERESHGKDAGVRTYALVSLGSALAMIVSINVYEVYKNAGVDPSRIAAQVISGVGFLGAGAIMRFDKEIKGLTTAAGVWTAAGIGLSCGLGQYHPAIITTILTLIVLVVWSKVNRFFGGKDY